ncbi:hypothetical protein H4R19_004600 [Coemansia spiralis]|nr:hypothetical protein H4R19_004600 [Coemansia spiralis]
MDSEIVRGLVTQMCANQAFDGCIQSVGAWLACRMVLDMHPELTNVATGLLYSTAIIDIDIDANMAVAIASNIPEIRQQGMQYSVLYLVVNVNCQAPADEPCHVYCGLPAIISELIRGTETLTAPATPPTTLSEILAASVETALTFMPNLVGLFAARVGSQCALTSDLVSHRCLSYCAPVLTSDTVELPAPVWQSDDTQFDGAAAEAFLTLPLGISTLGYLCRKPVHGGVLAHILADTKMVPTACYHGVPDQMDCHVRAHLYFSPAHPVLDSRGNMALYDWCQLAYAQEIDVDADLEAAV